jgi:hypothetical protein
MTKMYITLFIFTCLIFSKSPSNAQQTKEKKISILNLMLI